MEHGDGGGREAQGAVDGGWLFQHGLVKVAREQEHTHRRRHVEHRREPRAGQGSSEIRQDQAEHTQRHDGIEIGVDALQIIMLLVMT